MDKNNRLEHDALGDIGEATKVSLKGFQLSEEKKSKFRRQCRIMVLDILVKLAEKNTSLLCSCYLCIKFIIWKYDPSTTGMFPDVCSSC